MLESGAPVCQNLAPRYQPRSDAAWAETRLGTSLGLGKTHPLLPSPPPPQASGRGMSSHPFLRTPTGGTIRYPHRAVWQLTSLASRVFLCLLVLFILSALLAALYDVSQQLINSNRSSKIADVAITFGTYFVIVRRALRLVEGGADCSGGQAVVGIAIIVSRTMTDRGAVASIPKAYVPVKKQDVPKVSEGGAVGEQGTLTVPT